MDLTKFFFKYLVPNDLFLIRKNSLSLLKKKNSSFEQIHSDEGFILDKVNSYDPEGLRKYILNGKAALILSSTEFIFNILSFEKLPKKRKLKDELINWQIRKLIPEKLENYYHNFFTLKKNSVFSILIKKETKLKIENMFSSADITPVYFGCSTIEFLNGLKKRRIDTDLLFEMNVGQATLVFIEKFRPYYIRKIRFQKEDEAIDGLMKTIGFIDKNYGKKIRNVVFCSANKKENIINPDRVENMSVKMIHSKDILYPK